MKSRFTLLALLFLSLAVGSRAQIAAGDTFSLQKTVIANGGATSTNGAFSVENTCGQAVAGGNASSALFAVQSGFWTPQALAPTAATVTIGGRIQSAEGRGIKNAVITLTKTDGEAKTVVSGTLGYYRFTEVEVGASFILSITSKRFTFNPSTLFVTITEARDDLDFAAAQQTIKQ